MGFFPLRETRPLGSLPLDPRQIKEKTILLLDLDLENKLACKREIDFQPLSFTSISDHFHEDVPRSYRSNPVNTHKPKKQTLHKIKQFNQCIILDLKS